MKGQETIQNRVAQSGLITFDLEEYLENQESKLIDLSPWLYKGLIIREKELRASLKDHDWSVYKNVWVGVYCSNDAIIPSWVYMLIVVKLKPYTDKIIFGDDKDVNGAIIHDALLNLDTKPFKGKRIMIRGCSKFRIPEAAYMNATQKLSAIAQSVMYGDACSNVPLYKKQK